MEKDNSELFEIIVLPVVKRCSLIFLGWVASIIGCIYAVGIARTVLIVLFYALSIGLYFVAVQFGQAMEDAGELVKNTTKGFLWFLVNILTAIAIHYFLFWGNNAI